MFEFTFNFVTGNLDFSHMKIQKNYILWHIDTLLNGYCKQQPLLGHTQQEKSCVFHWSVLRS